MTNFDGTGDSTSAGDEPVESIPEVRDRSQAPPSDPIFGALADAQKALTERSREGKLKEWWRRDELDGALREIDRTWPKRKRYAAFDQIRHGKIPGWLYKAAGKRSAYILERFQSEPTLPREFRTTAEELRQVDDSRVRVRILQTIEMAVEDYRAVRARDPYDASRAPQFRSAKEGARWLHARGLEREEELRRLIDPYVKAVDSMLSVVIPDKLNELRWHRWMLSHSRTDRKIVDMRLMRQKIPETMERLSAFQSARFGYQWLLTVRAGLESR